MKSASSKYILVFGMALMAMLLGTVVFKKNTKPRSQLPATNTAQPQMASSLSPAPSQGTRAKSDPPWTEKLIAIQHVTDVFGEYGEENLSAINTCIESIPAGDLPRAIYDLQTAQSDHPTAGGLELLSRMLQRWAEQDVAAASAWSLQLPSGDTRSEALSTIARAWAKQNSVAAIAWAAALSSPEERAMAQEAIAGELVFNDPLRSLSLTCSLPPGSSRDDLITRAAMTWTESAPTAAADWAKNFPESALRQDVISHIAIAWSERDPGAATDLALNALPPGGSRDRALLGIIQRWMMIDAPAAKAWAEQFPDANVRQKAMAALEEYSHRN